MFGSGGTYFANFEKTSPFEPIVVTKGETILYRPAKHYRILYKYSTSGSCAEDPYYSGGNSLRVSTQADSLARFETIRTYHNPMYGSSELVLRVEGLNPGTTTATLTIRFTNDDMHYTQAEKSFDIDLIVLE